MNEDKSGLRGTLASMHPIYATESAFYCLVAVTRTGKFIICNFKKKIFLLSIIY